MGNAMAFGDLLKAVAQLSQEDQEALIEVLNLRLAEQRRVEIAREIQAAREEFVNGQCQIITSDELLETLYAEP